MYWPIGTPRIYAVNTTVPQPSAGPNSHSRVVVSHDGASIGNSTNDDDDDGDGDADSINPNDPLLKRPDAPAAKSPDPSEADTPRPDFPITPGLKTPLTPAVNAVDHDRFQDAWAGSSQQAQDVAGIPTGEPILGLTVSRTGHLFAVITSTTLTIWQSKVRSLCTARAT